MKKKDYILFFLGCALLFVTIIAILILRFKKININNIVGDCVLYKYYGLYCSGCGGTRAVKSLICGDVYSSLLYHPIVIYLTAFYFVVMTKYIICILTRNKIKPFRFRPVHGYIVIIIILLQCLIKNFFVIAFGVHVI